MGISGKSGPRIGWAIRTIPLMTPDLSAIRSMPSQSAITPISPSARVTAVLAMSMPALVIATIFTKRTRPKVTSPVATLSPRWAVKRTAPRRSLSRSDVIPRIVASGSGSVASLANRSSRESRFCSSVPA